MICKDCAVLAENQRHNLDATKSLRTELGAWLKDLRTDAGLSQRELANVLLLDYYTFISQLENGRGKIPPSRYSDWAKALGQNPKDFVVKLMSCYDPITYDILYGTKVSS